MNTPTQAQRNKIDSAIDKVASLCATDNAITPSQAIAKVASDMSLTPDYLPIIVRAYNTGAAAVHRDSSNTLQEKVASYPIADVDEVYRILKEDFPLNKKATVEPPKDDFWDHNADYYWPNAWDYLKKKPDFSNWKRPAVKMAKCTDYVDSLERKAQELVYKIADEATQVKYAAKQRRDDALERVEYELCKYAGVDLDDARRYAELSYGKEGVNVINKIIQDNRLEKKARLKTFLDDNHPFAKAFEEFADNSRKFQKAASEERQIIEACVKALSENEQPRDRYTEGMSDIDAMFKAGEDNRKKKIIKKAYTPLSADPISGMTGLEMMNHPGWKGLDRFERELMYSLANPAQEAKLRNIHVQTLLTDLMNTDPYLKEKDPEEVIDAVNEILEINPDIHKSKAMLRVALRQYLESGGMDIPTIGLVSEFGKEDRERRDRAANERAERASQEASERNRRFELEQENQYRARRDETADKQYEQQRKDRQSELKSRQDADKVRLEAETTRADADRKSREEADAANRKQRQTMWDKDHLLALDKEWNSNYNARMDREQRERLDETRRNTERDMERRRLEYNKALKQWQDYNDSKVSGKAYNNRYGTTGPNNDKNRKPDVAPSYPNPTDASFFGPRP